MDAFVLSCLGLLFVLMGLVSWWAIRSFKRSHWIRFVIAVALLVTMGFGWNYFPLLIWLILAPIFGWSFT